MKIFKTPRLLIRELKANDIPNIYAYGKEPIVFKFQNYGPVTLEEAEGFYKRTLKEQQSAMRKSYTYGIVLQSNNRVIDYKTCNLQKLRN